MMVSKRSEKAIKKVIAAKGDVEAVVMKKVTGNHTIIFWDLGGAELARFTLRSIIAKRGKKRAKK